MRSGKPVERGVAYLLLLLVIAIIGAASASSIVIGAQRNRGDAEDALLAVGAEFEQALSSYRGPGAVHSLGGGPKSFYELLKDPRSAGVRRHLRQLRFDPLTGTQEWGVIRHPDGSIAGVFSLAKGEPIKRTGFATHQAGFNNASSYAQWVFAAVPVRNATRQDLPIGMPGR